MGNSAVGVAFSAGKGVHKQLLILQQYAQKPLYGGEKAVQTHSFYEWSRKTWEKHLTNMGFCAIIILYACIMG